MSSLNFPDTSSMSRERLERAESPDAPKFPEYGSSSTPVLTEPEMSQMNAEVGEIQSTEPLDQTTGRDTRDEQVMEARLRMQAPVLERTCEIRVEKFQTMEDGKVVDVIRYRHKWCRNSTLDLEETISKMKRGPAVGSINAPSDDSLDSSGSSSFKSFNDSSTGQL